MRRVFVVCSKGILAASSVFKEPVSDIINVKRLSLTGILMFWVMIVMVPAALIVGVLAGMREGSKTTEVCRPYQLSPRQPLNMCLV